MTTMNFLREMLETLKNSMDPHGFHVSMIQPPNEDPPSVLIHLLESTESLLPPQRKTLKLSVTLWSEETQLIAMEKLQKTLGKALTKIGSFKYLQQDPVEKHPKGGLCQKSILHLFRIEQNHA